MAIGAPSWAFTNSASSQHSSNRGGENTLACHIKNLMPVGGKLVDAFSHFSWPSKQPILLWKVHSFLWRVVPWPQGWPINTHHLIWPNSHSESDAQTYIFIYPSCVNYMSWFLYIGISASCVECCYRWEESTKRSLFGWSFRRSLCETTLSAWVDLWLPISLVSCLCCEDVIKSKLIYTVLMRPKISPKRMYALT